MDYNLNRPVHNPSGWNRDAELLLRKGAVIFSLFMMVFIIAHFTITHRPVNMPQHLMYKTSGPVSFQLFVRDYRLWREYVRKISPEVSVLGHVRH